jgi:hypothetical protein
MNEQLQALEAAKLAALVGGQLKKVDSLTIERNGMPANKINIDGFVAKVRNPNSHIQNNFAETPHGFAPPVPEDIVQRLVPDTTVGSKPFIQNDLQAQQSHSDTQQRTVHSVTPTISYKENKQTFNQDSKTLKKINNNIKGIRLTLEQILATLKQK